ncbi:MAG TPA: ABC transporter ATP-binding protein [bacterium]|nr:ABC transporter ATP-binding protein [bacterium]
MIAIEKLTKTYRSSLLNPIGGQESVKALDDVSFSIKKGSLVSLVGCNGAGKTTLIKILSTLVLHDSGQAIVNGADVRTDPLKVRKSIGLFTGDERSFYWRLTVRDNLILFGSLQNVPRKKLVTKAGELLETFGLSGAADRPVRTLSSGMKQRLSLARCLIHDPPVLLLDEPTRGIDPLLQAQTIGMIRDGIVRDAGKTALVATHNLDEAIALGGETAVLAKGSLVFFGRPDDSEHLFGLLGSENTGFNPELKRT